MSKRTYVNGDLILGEIDRISEKYSHGHTIDKTLYDVLQHFKHYTRSLQEQFHGCPMCDDCPDECELER